MGLVDDANRLICVDVVIYIRYAGAHDVGAVDDEFDGVHINGDGVEQMRMCLEEF